MFVCWSWQRTQLCQQMLSSLLVCRIQKRLGSLKPSTPFYKLCIIYISIHRAAQVARMIQDAIPESASVHWTCLLRYRLAFYASALYGSIGLRGYGSIRQIKTGKDFRESDNLSRNVHLFALHRRPRFDWLPAAHFRLLVNHLLDFFANNLANKRNHFI